MECEMDAPSFWDRSTEAPRCLEEDVPSCGMERLVLCTGNEGKVVELRALLPKGVELLSLADVGLPTDLPETGETFAENALQKARVAFGATGIPSLADDSGLEVAALGGAPGVLSARYAGPAKDAHANMTRLLMELEGRGHREACFWTVLALVDAGGETTFEGEVHGEITLVPIGTGGFGYDPVFRPEGSELTFAQMKPAEKNSISHRGRAMRTFLAYLEA